MPGVLSELVQRVCDRLSVARSTDGVSITLIAVFRFAHVEIAANLRLI